MQRTKYIVITGGVLSGLGKGIVSASIGRLLCPQYNIVPIKCDGYLNVDPGTMNPIEHGEVFVLDDGGEVDLDFGHYERFINLNCKFNWNLTSGKIFLSLMEKERRGDFLGKTVQVIPHVTKEIRERVTRIADEEKADIVLIEIGGTVGDLENLWFLEAMRELRNEVEEEDIILIHLGLVPVIDEQGQQKTKPLQQSTLFLRERGLFPDVLIGRSKGRLSEKTKKKLHWLCNVKEENVISDPDCSSVYELPLIFQEEGLAQCIAKKLNLNLEEEMHMWRTLVEKMSHPTTKVQIAVCGKYTELADSYISIDEALKHASANLGIDVSVKWIETTDIENGKPVEEALGGCNGVIVPGGFGTRGTEGKIKIIQHVRENKIPFLGICLGMQLAVIEFARNVCGFEGAHSTEVKESAHPVVCLLPDQVNITEKGGTMRLGGQDIEVKEGTKAHALFNSSIIRRRFRHRYEVNPEYIERIEQHGLVFSGKAPHGQIMQLIELTDHPFFFGTQFHPELTSRLEDPSKLFVELVSAASRL